MSMRHLLLVLLPALVIGSGDDHDDHDDHAGTDEFEWAGIFPTPENYYMWTAQIGKTVSHSVSCGPLRSPQPPRPLWASARAVLTPISRPPTALAEPRLR